MAKALRHEQEQVSGQAPKRTGWNKRMSDHVAAALLIYTGLHIFVTMEVIEGEGASILPYFGLVVLVAAIIPGCRMFEKRWERLAQSSASVSQLRRLFNRDLVVLWVAALGLPVLITALIRSATELI